jgi:hypothetical protein
MATRSTAGTLKGAKTTSSNDALKNRMGPPTCTSTVLWRMSGATTISHFHVLSAYHSSAINRSLWNLRCACSCTVSPRKPPENRSPEGTGEPAAPVTGLDLLPHSSNNRSRAPPPSPLSTTHTTPTHVFIHAGLPLLHGSKRLATEVGRKSRGSHGPCGQLSEQ